MCAQCMYSKTEQAIFLYFSWETINIWVQEKENIRKSDLSQSTALVSISKHILYILHKALGILIKLLPQSIPKISNHASKCEWTKK